MNIKQTICTGISGISLFVVLCFPCFASEEAGGEVEAGANLRVVSYNVFEGLRYFDKRHERAVAWIAAQRPDVVALQELNNYTVEKLKEDARAWGHPYVELCEVK